MKICPACKKELSFDHFSWKNKQRGLRNSWCKACQKTRKDQHYKDNKQLYINKAAARRKENILFLNQYKGQRGCIKCPEKEPCALVFHHLDPLAKESTLTEAARRGWSRQRLLEEIKKCVVMCANCHRKLHAGIIKL